MSESPEHSDPSNQPPTLEQIQSVVKRLEQAIVDYLEMAPKLKLDITGENLLHTIDQVILEAEGRSEETHFEKDPIGYFLLGLYDELVQQPSNLFEKKTYPDGKEYWVPMNASVWRICLQRLRDDIELTLTGNSDSQSHSHSQEQHPMPNLPPSPASPPPSAPGLEGINRLFGKR